MELVVLLDEDGNPTGTAPKAAVHHADTPLHLAFSCYLFDPAGRLLLTQRALTKATWPGVWTNSCCGHPAPGERLTDAVERRLAHELGVRATALDLVLPRFRYRSVMPDGTMENEMCPVFRATTSDLPRPLPDEVADTRWVPWREFAASVTHGHRDVSPWCRLQVEQISALGDDPRDWPVGELDALPPAVRPVGSELA